MRLDTRLGGEKDSFSLLEYFSSTTELDTSAGTEIWKGESRERDGRVFDVISLYGVRRRT